MLSGGFFRGRNLVFYSLLFSALIACADNSKTTMSINDSNSLQPVTTDNHLLAAREALNSHLLDQGKSNDAISYTFISESRDVNGSIHVKLQPEYQQVPVWSREIIVHLDKDQHFSSLSGQLPDINNLKTEPDITDEDAQTAALDYMSRQANHWQADSVRLVIYPDNEKNSLAYLVQVSGGMNRKFLFVSAEDGRVLHTLSGTPTALIK